MKQEWVDVGSRVIFAKAKVHPQVEDRATVPDGQYSMPGAGSREKKKRHSTRRRDRSSLKANSI